jgi:hypothetical protein
MATGVYRENARFQIGDGAEINFSYMENKEKLNEFFFEFLRPIVQMTKEKTGYPFLLQMLLSNYQAII